jgi:hypothetical protein
VQINFHVTGARRGIANLNDRALKIRAAFDTDKSGMKNADGVSGVGFEPVAFDALMLPGGLKQAFGGRTAFLVQDIGRGKLRPPQGVKMMGWRKHFSKCLRLRFVKVKPPDEILNATNGEWIVDEKPAAEFLLAVGRVFRLYSAPRFDE